MDAGGLTETPIEDLTVDLDKLDRMTKDRRFIPGVYNYCDRWCERCPLTSRCLTCAMAEDDDTDSAAHDIHAAAFWRKLHAIFGRTLEMLERIAEQQGIDLGEADLKAIAEDERRIDERVRDHELTESAREYARAVVAWFESSEPPFEREGERLAAAARMGLDGVDPAAEAADLADAVDVVRWHQHQIGVKLARALHQDEHDGIGDGPRDSDGSAKVALLGIDRSIAAWGVLRAALVDERDTTLDMLVRLNRLRRRTEQAFPRARSFVRPGFDEPAPPVG